MRGFIIIVTLSIASLIGSSAAVAQEGFPLKGSWVGDWGPSKLHSDDLLMVINWDGKAITGMVNPGTDNMALKTATLKPEGWVVHFEFDGKDAKGAAVSYVLDGKIENLPFTNRSLTGTWKGGAETGKFKLVRQ